MGLRGGPEHLQGCVIHVGVGDVQLQVQAFLQGIGPLCHDIEGVDAVNGDMPLCNHLGTCLVEIDSDNDIEL